MRLTQSILSDSDNCLRRAQYRLDPPPWVRRTGGSIRALGTGYHAGLELLYRARLEQAPLPTLDDMVAAACATFDTSTTVDLYDETPLDEFKWDERVPDTPTAHDSIARMLGEYMRAGMEWPHDWEVLGVEVHAVVTDPVVGAQLKFGADLVLRDPNGWIVLDDHKTAGRAWDESKHLPRKNVQAPFYQRLARTLYPDAAGYRFTFTIVTYPSAKGIVKAERRISDPQPEHEAAVALRAKTFLDTYRLVHEEAGLDLPANPSSTLCNPKWCDYWAGCPHGAALDDDN
jgi:hypothetical protein